MDRFLKKVLINARHVISLVAAADRDAFCCGDSIEKLQDTKSFGAIDWIKKFENQVNGTGHPLPDVLKRTGQQWYELKDSEIAEIFTMMNPDKRLFFSKFETPSFINQRLIGLRHTDDYPDIELNHALLNSMFTMFYIEASGFGRGLGVLDINKTSIKNSFMLNPKLIDNESRNKIVNAFYKLKSRNIMNIEDELCDQTRIDFEHEVLQSYGLDEYFDDIKDSLISMQHTRHSALI